MLSGGERVIVTCPEVTCRFNGFGECQLGLVAEAIQNGPGVSQDACPYYESAESAAAPERHPPSS